MSYYLFLKEISFHVTCIVLQVEDKLVTQTFVHVFEETNQDVDAVIEIIDSVLSKIKFQFGLKEIFYKSDNAGCYKNKSLISVLYYFARKHGHQLKRIDYCEPNAGKDICDRKIAPIRRVVQNYIDSGNDVMTPVQLKQAIESNSSLQGCQVIKWKMNSTMDFKNNFCFPNVTSYQSFSFEYDYLLSFRYYNISEGKKYLLTSFLKFNVNDLIKKVKYASLTVLQDSISSEFYRYAVKSSNMKIFQCNKCEFTTFSKKSLKKHSFVHIDEQHLSQYSKNKLDYSKLINDLRKSNTMKTNELNKDIEQRMKEAEELLPKGYALKIKIRTT